MPPETSFVIAITREIVEPAARVLLAAAFVFFLFGLGEFIWHTDESDKRNIGKRHMLWGIIGLFIMVAAVSILNVTVQSFFPVEDVRFIIRQ